MIFILAHETARRRAMSAVAEAPEGYRVEVLPPKRSGAHNDRMWVLLGAISRQVDWYGQKLTDEEWKDVFTASLKRQKVVPGLDGGFVVLGTRTSRMPSAEMSELQSLIEAFGAERGVDFHEKEEA